MIPTKIYSFAIPAGGAFQVQVIGEYFKIASAYGAVEVRGDTFGTIGQLAPGQGLRDTPFGRLEFRDLSGLRNEVSIIVAGEYFVDDRVQGVVEVMDGNRARSIAGGGYQWRCTSQNTSAINRPMSQLWNPPSSGMRVIVDGMLFGCTIATSVTWGINSVAMPNPAPSAIRNVLSDGGPVSQAQALVNELPGYPPVGVLGAVYVSASGSSQVPMARPIVLMPGAGLLVISDTGGGPPVTLSGCIQFFEEAV